MEIYSLTFNYRNGEISSIRVFFSPDKDDSILISSKFVTELRKYLDISEEDTELFYIIGRAIQLRKENERRSSQSVNKYRLGDKYESFHEAFISKLMDVAKQVSFDIIALYFDDDCKLEDLDIFLNKKSSYELALMMKDGFPIEDFDGEYED